MNMASTSRTELPDEKAASLYSVGEVAKLFDLPESRLRYWSQTGFIAPDQRQGNRRYYSFRNLISVKVAKELLNAGLPLQRVRRSLHALRLHLPSEETPLARLRIRSEGERILVEEGESTFDAVSGQLLLDFNVEKLRDQVAEVLEFPTFDREKKEPSFEEGGTKAYECFLRGQAYEVQWDGYDVDAEAYLRATASYERALEIDPEFAAASTNLGTLLAQGGDIDGARDRFDQALSCDPDQPEARCNLAELALRTGEIELAIEGFRQVLRVAPRHLEAHYGLARGLLEVGGRGQALAHLERFCAEIERIPQDECSDELRERQQRARGVIESLRREREG